jgi:hypothetical protein
MGRGSKIEGDAGSRGHKSVVAGTVGETHSGGNGPLELEDGG